MMCRVGSVVAPFCVYLRSVWIFMPLVSIYSMVDASHIEKVCMLLFFQDKRLNFSFEVE